MSRRQSEERPGLSPIQRKACLVLALCVLAVVLSFVASWILPQKLALFGGSDLYDPTQYPLDTSLDAILGQESAQGNYINDTVFVGGTCCGRPASTLPSMPTATPSRRPSPR